MTWSFLGGHGRWSLVVGRSRTADHTIHFYWMLTQALASTITLPTACRLRALPRFFLRLCFRAIAVHRLLYERRFRRTSFCAWALLATACPRLQYRLRRALGRSRECPFASTLRATCW